MRIIIFCMIVLLVASGASAQDQDGAGKKQITIPSQNAVTDGVTLNIIANTPPGKRDLKHTIVFPKNMTRDEAIDACVKEMAEFLKHRFPDQVEMRVRVGTCVVPEFAETPS